MKASMRLLSVVGVLVAAGCSDDPVGLGDPTGSTCPADSTLTWTSFGQSFIEDNCAHCHDSESPRIVTQADVQANLDLIDRAAAAGPDATNTYMPEDGDVATGERKKLGEWLACGAP
jgi:hypothetical protein